MERKIFVIQTLLTLVSCKYSIYFSGMKAGFFMDEASVAGGYSLLIPIRIYAAKWSLILEA